VCIRYHTAHLVSTKSSILVPFSPSPPRSNYHAVTIPHIISHHSLRFLRLLSRLLLLLLLLLFLLVLPAVAAGRRRTTVIGKGQSFEPPFRRTNISTANFPRSTLALLVHEIEQSVCAIRRPLTLLFQVFTEVQESSNSYCNSMGSKASSTQPYSLTRQPSSILRGGGKPELSLRQSCESHSPPTSPLH
jgi:hypothetical protein